MPPSPPSAFRTRTCRGRPFLPLVELLEERLPPGDLLWALLPLPLVQASAAVSSADAYTQRDISLANAATGPGSQPFEVFSANLTEERAASSEKHTAAASTASSLNDDFLAPLGTAARPTRPLEAATQSGGSIGSVPFTGGARVGLGGVSTGGGAAFLGASSDGLFAALNSAQPVEVPQSPPPTENGGPGTQAVVNLSITNIEVTQGIQRLDNSVGLVANRATMVRVYVGLSGSATPVADVRGELYIYQNYAELPGGPIYPINNGITARPTPNRGSENDTLNFLLPALSGNIMLVPVVYAWGSEEADWGNNYNFFDGFGFNCRRSPTIAYIPTDYRPSGGITPNVPNAAMIAPGVGDDFVRAIYPIPNVNYFQVPGGPLLWTRNINDSTNLYFNALNQRRQMTTPTPDVLYGWLPGNPFSGNGAAMIDGRVSFGNTEPSRYLRTFAHELGHNFGLQHNNRQIGQVGIDVNNSIGLGRVKATSLYDIMAAGLLTNQAFVDVQSYTHFYNHPWTQCTAGPGGAPGSGSDGDYLFVTGLIDGSGNATLNPTYRLQGDTTYTESQSDGEYALVIHTSPGVVREVRFNASTHTANEHEPSCSCPTCMGAAFSLVLPNDPTITKLEVLRNGQVQDQLVRSARAPVASLTAAPASLRGETTIAWSAGDADGDALLTSIQYSPDGGKTLIPVVVSETGTQFTFNADHLPPSANGFLRFLITDGLNTTTVEQAVTVLPTS